MGRKGIMETHNGTYYNGVVWGLGLQVNRKERQALATTMHKLLVNDSGCSFLWGRRTMQQMKQ